jgi:hypothetical protein
MYMYNGECGRVCTCTMVSVGVYNGECGRVCTCTMVSAEPRLTRTHGATPLAPSPHLKLRPAMSDSSCSSFSGGRWRHSSSRPSVACSISSESLSILHTPTWPRLSGLWLWLCTASLRIVGPVAAHILPIVSDLVQFEIVNTYVNYYIGWIEDMTSTPGTGEQKMRRYTDHNALVAQSGVHYALSQTFACIGLVDIGGSEQ